MATEGYQRCQYPTTLLKTINNGSHKGLELLRVREAHIAMTQIDGYNTAETNNEISDLELDTLLAKQTKMTHLIASLSLISLMTNTMFVGAMLILLESQSGLSQFDLLNIIYSVAVVIGSALILLKLPSGIYLLVIHWTWLVLQGSFELYHYFIESDAALHPLLTTEYQIFKEQILASGIFKVFAGLPIVAYLGKCAVDDLVKPIPMNTKDHASLL